MKHHLNHYLLAPLALMISLASQAAPSITNLQITSSEIVLTGTAFGNGPQVALFDNFSHGDKFKNLLNSQGNQISGGLLFREPDGNIAHRAKDPVQFALGKSGLSQIISVFPKAYQTALVAFSVKVPKGTTFAGASTPKTFSTMSSWKFSWLMLGANGFQEIDKFDVCLPTHPGGGNMLLSGNTGTLGWAANASNWWEWDNYNHMTSYIKTDKSAPSTTPIKYSFDVVNHNGHYTAQGDNAQFMTSSFQQTNFTFDRVNIPGWWGNGDNANFDGLYDNVYVAVGDNALARVVVTDSADYNKSHFAIPIMTKSWSNTQISIDPDAAPRNGDTFYYYVIDSAGSISPTPAAVLTSNVPCPLCPNAPKPM